MNTLATASDAETLVVLAIPEHATNHLAPLDLPSAVLMGQVNVEGTAAHRNAVELGATTELLQDAKHRPAVSIDQLLEKAYNPFVLIPSPQSTEFFKVIQKWEGYVTEVTEDSFWARLAVLVGEEGDLDAEILLNAVDKEDLPLVTPGAVFYWSIGYKEDERARVTQASVIRFRRLPAWSGADQMRADVIEEKLKHLFDE